MRFKRRSQQANRFHSGENTAPDSFGPLEGHVNRLTPGSRIRLSSPPANIADLELNWQPDGLILTVTQVMDYREIDTDDPEKWREITARCQGLDHTLIWWNNVLTLGIRLEIPEDEVFDDDDEFIGFINLDGTDFTYIDDYEAECTDNISPSQPVEYARYQSTQKQSFFDIIWSEHDQTCHGILSEAPAPASVSISVSG